MIKSLKKKREFKKKRSWDEDRVHSDKKRKRSKKMIQESIFQKSMMLFSEIISNEFSLSSAKTITISDRTFNLASFSDDRARQLSKELEKVRQQYQMKRMTELNQSERLIIDEILRYEYDLDTSERSTQIITSFTSINVRAQTNMFISTHRIISQTSSIVDFSAAISNAIFDLEEFLSELETIIFERDEIEKDISVDQVRVDSQLKRIVLVFFNENDAIMKRIIEYDYDERKINVKNETYRVYRETFLKTKNIIYRRDWKRMTKKNEKKRVFEMMSEKEWVKEWEYRSYDHMRKSRHIRNILSTAFKRKVLFDEEDDFYLEYRIYRRDRVSSTKVEKAMNETIKKIESLVTQLRECLNQMRSIDVKERLKSVDNFAKELTRLTDAIIIIMSKFAKKSNDWKH